MQFSSLPNIPQVAAELRKYNKANRLRAEKKTSAGIRLQSLAV